jgi:hypothetical protein
MCVELPGGQPLTNCVRKGAPPMNRGAPGLRVMFDLGSPASTRMPAT